MNKISLALLLSFSSLTAFAFDADAKANDEVQDMTDPLAVYTQAGAGTTNKGLNFKIGQSYDSGSPTTMAMNVLEIMGSLGDTLGWESGHDNSIDSLRFRNFKVDTTNGRGAQIDVSYSFDESNTAKKSGTASYAIMQALPKMSIFQLYPLAGVGVAFGKDLVEYSSDDQTKIDDGFGLQGAYVLAGMYAKITITDKIWLNYNPFYLYAVAGDDYYTDNAYGKGNSGVLTHEFVASYQFTPRFNLRYFANWNQNIDLKDGGHRVEFNYQF